MIIDDTSGPVHAPTYCTCLHVSIISRLPRSPRQTRFLSFSSAVICVRLHFYSARRSIEQPPTQFPSCCCGTLKRETIQSNAAQTEDTRQQAIHVSKIKEGASCNLSCNNTQKQGSLTLPGKEKRWGKPLSCTATWLAKDCCLRCCLYLGSYSFSVWMPGGQSDSWRGGERG